MRNVLFMILCSSIFMIFAGCDSSNKSKDVKNEAKREVDEPMIDYERFGTFPGGDEELLKFLDRNLNKAIVGDSHLEPKRAVFRFCVDTSGRVFNIRTIRSYNKNIDSECIRVLYLMPNWTPSYNKEIGGVKKVMMTYSMPFMIPWKTPNY